jgi:peptidoglycan/xylan/chitin deacetylase (PgdA/CDA1 family)
VSAGRPPERPPWLPEGLSAIGVFTVDVDGEAGVGEAVAGIERRPMIQSLARYGPEVGVWRLLDLLAQAGVPATFFVPGYVAELHPHLVPGILAAGHEVAAHGHRHRRPSTLAPAEEREEVERGLAVLRGQGANPVGYKAPFWDPGPGTLAMVAAAGLRYDASLMDRDWPYRLSEGMVELPTHWQLDDWEWTGYLPEPGLEYPLRSPLEWLGAWDQEFEARMAFGGLALVTVHPWISGRPGPALALRDWLARWRDRAGFRWLAARDVAALVP